MGWKDLKNRAEQFKQQTAAAREREKNQLKLDYHPTVTNRQSYECVPEAGATPPITGAVVRLINTPDGIDIYDGNRPVGQVSVQTVSILREQHGMVGRPGQSVQGRIADVSDLTNTFTVDISQ
ncbi:MAG: hypothetical protein U1F83_18890 [Verrucomicrobiota bacterium]